MWDNFIAAHPEHVKKTMPEAWYFCDNEKDANECATLVKEGIKQATSTSLWWYKKNEATLPKVGDIYIITTWDGKASAIIQTTQVDQVPYSEIDSNYAKIEGEGDKSLTYWRKVHWDYYSREMAPFNETPTEDMIIVCEQFKTVWK